MNKSSVTKKALWNSDRSLRKFAVCSKAKHHLHRHFTGGKEDKRSHPSRRDTMRPSTYPANHRVLFLDYSILYLLLFSFAESQKKRRRDATGQYPRVHVVVTSIFDSSHNSFFSFYSTSSSNSHNLLPALTLFKTQLN